MADILVEGNLTIVTPDSNVVADKVELLRGDLLKALDAGATSVAVDMRHVEIIDSMGIGVLITTFNSLKKKGGSLEIRNLSDNIRKMFKIMRLDHHFIIV